MHKPGGLCWIVLGCAVLALTLLGAIFAPNLMEARQNRNETAALRALRRIVEAQSMYRETDKEGDGNLDYGTLEELALVDTAGLIDSVLGSGTYEGYVFECSYGASTSEFIWFATARPLEPGATGSRFFATNQEGVMYYTSQKAFALNTIECTMPPGVQPG